MAGKKEEKDIQCKVIKMLKNTANQKGDGGVWIRIVAWIINGKEYKPSLEKREFYVGERGEMMGKAKGFSGEEFLFLLSVVPEIAKHMKIDPRFISEAIAAAPTMTQEPVAAADGRETF